MKCDKCGETAHTLIIKVGWLCKECLKKRTVKENKSPAFFIK